MYILNLMTFFKFKINLKNKIWLQHQISLCILSLLAIFAFICLNIHITEILLSKNSSVLRDPNSLSSPIALQQSGLSNYFQLVAYNDITEYKNTLNKIIPNDLEPTNEPALVFNKIADKSLNTLIETDSFKHSTLGRFSDRIKEKTATDIKFTSNLLSPVVHDLRAELDPFQGQTKLRYSGFFLADLIFKENELNFKIQNYFFNKKLYYERHLSKNSMMDQI